MQLQKLLRKVHIEALNLFIYMFPLCRPGVWRNHVLTAGHRYSLGMRGHLLSINGCSLVLGFSHPSPSAETSNIAES